MGYVLDNLSIYSNIAQCIAMQFGENCEVVLHDLTLPYNQTIVGIWNGHVTGRKVGDGGTNAGLEVLKGVRSSDEQYCYINKLPNGKLLRSSSMYFSDQNQNIVGSLCINLDISDIAGLNKTLNYLCTSERKPEQKMQEFFSGNIDELLEYMMTEAVKGYHKEIKDLTKDEKVSVVHELNGKGFFLVKKAAETLADFLGMSRYSIYNYLNEK